MATLKEKLTITSTPCVFRKKEGKIEWFLVKHEKTGDWELPKSTAKPTESSVRTSVRLLLENAGLSGKVLEEIGRSGGAARVGGKIVSQRIIYYLMLHKEGGDPLGYVETEWTPHAVAIKRIKTKRDIQMLKDGKALLSDVEKKRGKPYRDTKFK